MEDYVIKVILQFNHILMIRTISFLLLLVSLAACDTNKSSNNKNNQASDGIRRYEVDLFNIDTSHFEKGVEEIYPNYKVFLGSSLPDKGGMQQLRDFVTDPAIREIYDYTMKRFPNLDNIKSGLDAAFKIYEREFPGAVIPVVYTYISGFDIRMPIKYADSTLIIGLDLYLGSDYETYLELGYPVYITNRFSPEYIISDCFKEICWSQMPEITSNVLLDAMIEQGKLIYFAEVILPDEKPEILMKYTAEQLKWVNENEKNLWSFIIENQLLYSTDAKAITMFMTDGPFTSGFSDQSPSRTGHWLGWQIVRNYMKNNKVTLKELLEDTDSQKILQQSGYKPTRD